MFKTIIVDDEEDLLNGIKDNFPWQKYGFIICETFTSAQQAIKYLEENQIDLIITDIKMPFMFGFQLIEKTKQTKNQDSLFCLLSAYDDFKFAQKAISLGVEEYLLKPASIDSIAKMLKKTKKRLNTIKHDYSIISGFDLQFSNPLISQAYEIMKKDIKKANLQYIADVLCINSSYLSRLFKNRTNKNFHEILIEEKMNQAKVMLLSNNNYTVKEIALTVGYNDVQNFYRAFRKKFKTTPKKLREKMIYDSK